MQPRLERKSEIWEMKRRFDSDPRLHRQVPVVEAVKEGGMATVSGSVSELRCGITTRPQFAKTPLKLADYSLTR